MLDSLFLQPNLEPSSNASVSPPGNPAALIDSEGHMIISDVPLPALPDGGAIIQVTGCGLCGSDLDKVVNRKVAAGTVLGHEIVGRIAILSNTAPPGWSLGQRIVASHHVPCNQCRYCVQDSESMCQAFKNSNFVPGGFASYLALSQGHLEHTTFPIPDGVNDAIASCVEPLACVLRAFRRDRGRSVINTAPHKDRKRPETSSLIVGLGFIGLLAAQTYAMAGDAVYGVDVNDDRLNWAIEQGIVKAAFNPLNRNETGTLPGILQKPVDTVFLTAVNPGSLKLAFDSVRDGGRIVLFASSGAQGRQHVLPEIDPSVLYFREISLVTSYSPALRDLQDSASIIFNRLFPVNSLVSDVMPLSDIAMAIEAYRTGQSRKVFINIGTHNNGEGCPQ